MAMATAHRRQRRPRTFARTYLAQPPRSVLHAWSRRPAAKIDYLRSSPSRRQRHWAQSMGSAGPEGTVPQPRWAIAL